MHYMSTTSRLALYYYDYAIGWWWWWLWSTYGVGKRSLYWACSRDRSRCPVRLGKGFKERELYEPLKSRHPGTKPDALLPGLTRDWVSAMGIRTIRSLQISNTVSSFLATVRRWQDQRRSIWQIFYHVDERWDVENTRELPGTIYGKVIKRMW